MRTYITLFIVLALAAPMAGAAAAQAESGGGAARERDAASAPQAAPGQQGDGLGPAREQEQISETECAGLVGWHMGYRAGLRSAGAVPGGPARDARSRAERSLCGAGEGADRLFSALDRNRDGRLTRAELERFTDKVMQADKDGKGYVTREDAVDGARELARDRLASSFIGKYDADKDGDVTSDELGGDLDIVASLDVDDNGRVNLEDFEAMTRDTCPVVYSRGLMGEAMRGGPRSRRRPGAAGSTGAPTGYHGAAPARSGPYFLTQSGGGGAGGAGAAGGGAAGGAGTGAGAGGMGGAGALPGRTGGAGAAGQRGLGSDSGTLDGQGGPMDRGALDRQMTPRAGDRSGLGLRRDPGVGGADGDGLYYGYPYDRGTDFYDDGYYDYYGYPDDGFDGMYDYGPYPYDGYGGMPYGYDSPWWGGQQRPEFEGGYGWSPYRGDLEGWPYDSLYDFGRFGDQERDERDFDY